MDRPAHIRIWMGNNVPDWIWRAIGGPEPDAGQSDLEEPEINGQIIVFVAHVPAAILANRVYQRGNWEAENSGWMSEGQLGLFGTNALNVYPDPEGDGILVVGSAV